MCSRERGEQGSWLWGGEELGVFEELKENLHAASGKKQMQSGMKREMPDSYYMSHGESYGKQCE